MRLGASTSGVLVHRVALLLGLLQDSCRVGAAGNPDLVSAEGGREGGVAWKGVSLSRAIDLSRACARA